jgi:hypothetical protein
MEPALPSTYRSVKDTHPWHQEVLEFLDIVLEIQISLYSLIWDFFGILRQLQI